MKLHIFVDRMISLHIFVDRNKMTVAADDFYLKNNFTQAETHFDRDLSF